MILLARLSVIESVSYERAPIKDKVGASPGRGAAATIHGRRRFLLPPLLLLLLLLLALVPQVAYDPMLQLLGVVKAELLLEESIHLDASDAAGAKGEDGRVFGHLYFCCVPPRSPAQAGAACKIVALCRRPLT